MTIKISRDGNKKIKIEFQPEDDQDAGEKILDYFKTNFEFTSQWSQDVFNEDNIIILEKLDGDLTENEIIDILNSEKDINIFFNHKETYPRILSNRIIDPDNFINSNSSKLLKAFDISKQSTDDNAFGAEKEHIKFSKANSSYDNSYEYDSPQSTSNTDIDSSTQEQEIEIEKNILESIKQRLEEDEDLKVFQIENTSQNSNDTNFSITKNHVPVVENNAGIYSFYKTNDPNTNKLIDKVCDSIKEQNNETVWNISCEKLATAEKFISKFSIDKLRFDPNASFIKDLVKKYPGVQFQVEIKPKGPSLS